MSYETDPVNIIKEPYRTILINESEYDLLGCHIYDTISELIECSIQWDKTAEGELFWFKLHLHYMDLENKMERF